MSAAPHRVLVDLTICVFPPTVSPPFRGGHRWHRVEKDLHLHTSQQSAHVYLALVDEDHLMTGDLIVTDVRVGDPPSYSRTNRSWQERSCGIWIQISEFSGSIDRAVTGLDVLFGADSIDPRPEWTLLQPFLQLNALATDVRLTIRRDKSEPGPGTQEVLRVNGDGKFKIVQLSDTHMVTGVGVCKDAIDAHGNHLPEMAADPLTARLMRRILNTEKPDLVVLSGDQLHHGTSDSQTALFKVAAPIIESSTPFVAIFGNHDCEGNNALSREAQMLILQNLPYSLCEPGPENVDGIGNFHLQILGPVPSSSPMATLYFLDSHGQIPSNSTDPDYKPIQQSQIDWFVSASRKARNARKTSGQRPYHLPMTFLHIPTPEYGDSRLCIRSGYRREPTEGPSSNTHFYDALANEGMLVLSCGHDHVNDFCALLPQPQDNNHTRPWLVYGGGIGFGGYCSYNGDRFHRRARVWELDTCTGSITTWLRVEYNEGRIDELVLVEKGSVVDTLEDVKNAQVI